MAYTLYSNIRGLRNILSASGVALRIDDMPPDVLGDVLGMASDDTEEYLWARYRVVLQQGGNSWIGHRNSEIAAYYLCQRRANPVPSSIASRHEACIKKYEAVRAGRFNIPQAADTKPLVPILTQTRIKLTPFGPVPVVEKAISTGVAQNYNQHWDVLEIYDLWYW